MTLRSGMYGNGGRTASGNGRASQRTSRKSHAPKRETPYRVARTTAGAWTTAVAHNTNRVWREER